MSALPPKADIDRQPSAVRFVPIVDIQKDYFTNANPKKVAKKYFDDCAYSGQGTSESIQICWLLAPDLSLALALRGADAMWTVLFSVTFVIAVALQLAVLSQVD